MQRMGRGLRGVEPRKGRFVFAVTLQLSWLQSDKVRSMWTIYEFLGEVMHRPSDRMEELTPWIVTVIGGVIVGIMGYAWWVAPAF